jgi:hypothetical protein
MAKLNEIVTIKEAAKFIGVRCKTPRGWDGAHPDKDVSDG